MKNKVVIVSIDTGTTFADMINNPSAYNFTNVTNHCYLGSFMPGEEATACTNQNQYLFWDNLHPTTATHCFIEKTALKSLKESGLLDASAYDAFSCAAP